MAGKKDNTKLIITDYIKNLSGIKVDNVFVFGSRAIGRARKDSDFDCLVISDDFSGIDFMKRMQLLSRARSGAAAGVAMDIFGYTKDELARMKTDDSPNVKKIVREMVEII